jgi:hypothetical protein
MCKSRSVEGLTWKPYVETEIVNVPVEHPTGTTLVLDKYPIQNLNESDYTPTKREVLGRTNHLLFFHYNLSIC